MRPVCLEYSLFFGLCFETGAIRCIERQERGCFVDNVLWLGCHL